MPVVTRLGLLLFFVLLVGCSPAAQSASPSPSTSPPPSASSTTPAPSLSTPIAQPPASSTALFSLLPTEQPADFNGQITCTGPIGTSDPVAVVQLDESSGSELVLRDYSDWTNPRTACTFVYVTVDQLIDAHHVVIGWGGSAKYAVVDLPEVTVHWFALPPWSPESYSTLIAVSPQMDQVTWLQERPSQDPSITTREIHITTAAGDTVAASLTDQPTGFCGAPLDSSKRGAYSLSGEHLYLLDQGFSGPADYSLRVLEGLTTVLPVLPPSGGWPEGQHPAMAVWSPISETLYYRQGKTVWQWTPTGADSFLPGVNWSSPTISPDGKTVAYWLPGVDGTGEVYLADLESGASPRRIGQARGAPIFLNDAQLWYISAPIDRGCIGIEGGPTIYNVTDGSEAPSVIAWVRGVWPAVTSAP